MNDANLFKNLHTKAFFSYFIDSHKTISLKTTNLDARSSHVPQHMRNCDVY